MKRRPFPISFMVADDPDNKIDLRIFHNAISNDHQALKRKQDWLHAGSTSPAGTPVMIQLNYGQIRQEIEKLVTAEMERIIGDPGTAGTVMKKT